MEFARVVRAFDRMRNLADGTPPVNVSPLDDLPHPHREPSRGGRELPEHGIRVYPPCFRDLRGIRQRRPVPPTDQDMIQLVLHQSVVEACTVNEPGHSG